MDQRHTGGQTHPHPLREPRYPGAITLARLEEIFRDCVDFVRRTVWVGDQPGRSLTLCYLSGMVRMERISDYLLRPWPRTRPWPSAPAWCR